MAKVYYSDRQVNEFIEAAKEMGISPAIRHMGYPTWSTAQRWFNEKGIPLPTIDSLLAKAAEMKIFYTDKEKKYAVQSVIDRVVESLQQDNLTADEINKLANALNKAIQTFQLIEGKATTISESHQKDGTDLAVMDMLNSAKAKNALKESELS